MLRKQFLRSLSLHVIIYLSPKYLKRVEKVKKTHTHTQKKNKDSDNPGQKSLGQYCNVHIFLLFLGSFLKQCSVFEILLQFSLLPPYTKLKHGKSSGYTRLTCDFLEKNIGLVQQVSCQVACKISQCCIRARYRACKTVFFLSVCFSVFFFVVFICFFFCLVICMLMFLFLFLLKNSLLLIVQLSFSFLVLFYVSFFGEKNRTDKDKLPIDVRKEKHIT